MLRTLLQPRYAALSVLMVIVAAICIGAGTWQIARLSFKITANDTLRDNAHARVIPIGALVPVVGNGTTPTTDGIKYRTVSATGTFQTAGQVLVRQRSVSSDTGYLVLTPLRTVEGPVLLVVRGFISGTSATASSTSAEAPAIPSPPTSTVTITARLEPGESRADDFAQLQNGEVESINPTEQAGRLDKPVYNAYAELMGGQAGSTDLIAIPAPDLSNPAGGAIEPQHLAYVIQWYLFAGLALAAPLAMARAETRRDATDEFGDRTPADSAGPTQTQDALVNVPGNNSAARLADRYGRSNVRTGRAREDL